MLPWCALHCDTRLRSQAGDLDGLRRTSRLLVIYDIQRYCAIAVNGIRLVMSRSCANKMIVAETVLLQNRVQVQIYRVAAQSGHGHVVIFCTDYYAGNVVVLQSGNGSSGTIIHGQRNGLICAACHGFFADGNTAGSRLVDRGSISQGNAFVTSRIDRSAVADGYRMICGCFRSSRGIAGSHSSRIRRRLGIGPDGNRVGAVNLSVRSIGLSTLFIGYSFRIDLEIPCTE